MAQNDFLIGLVGGLDPTKSKQKLDSDIEQIKNQLNELELTAVLSPAQVKGISGQLDALQIRLSDAKLTQDALDGLVAQINNALSGIQILNPTASGNQGQQAGKQIGQQVQQGMTSAIQKGNFQKDFFFSSVDINNVAKDAQEYFRGITNSIVTVNESMEQLDGKSQLNSFIINIRNAKGEIESLKYTLQNIVDDDGKVTGQKFGYVSGTINDANAVKQFAEINKTITDYEIKLQNLQTKYANADIDYSGFNAVFGNFKNGTATVNELALAFNTLKTSAEKGVQSLKSQTASLDPIQQTLNNMRDMPSMIKQLETGMSSLKDKTSVAGISIKDINQNYQDLYSEMTSNGGKVPLTADWTASYQELMSTIASATKQVDALKKAEASDDSNASQQAKYYSSILSNYREAYAIKKKLLTAGEEESKILQAQLRSLNASTAASYKQINAKGLSSKDWEEQVSALKKSEEYSLKAATARQKDNEAAKESKRLAQESAKAEKEQFSIIEKQKKAAVDLAKEKAKTAKAQDANQENEVNSILSKQSSEYGEIWKIKKQIATLDPNTDAELIAALEIEKKRHQENYLLLQNQLKAYGSLALSQEHINELIQIQKKYENEIQIATARQNRKIQLSIDTGEYDSKVSSLIAKSEQWTNANNLTNGSIERLNAAYRVFSNAKDGDEKIQAAKALGIQIKETTNEVRKLNAEYEKDSKISSLHQRVQEFYDKNTATHQKWGAELRDILNQTAEGAVLTNEQLSKIEATFIGIGNAARQSGRLGKSFLDSIKESASKFSQWVGVSSIIMQVVSRVKEANTELKDMNSILTEISKTNDSLSQSDLAQIGDNAFETASEYGKKASDYLLGVQEMSRAGYDNAESMGELSTAVQGAGDIEAELANSYIIATDKAYKLNGSVDALMRVLDGANKITNENAVNMTELAEGMSIVGSQAASSQVSVEETTAAIGTLVAVTQQGGSEMGNAFKGILMNLRQVTGEVEDGGDAIDETSLTKYEKACKELGVSLTEVKDGIVSLKKPMQILKELSEAYTKLDESDAKRANLLSSVGGKFYHVIQKCITRMNLIAGNALEPCTTI